MNRTKVPHSNDCCSIIVFELFCIGAVSLVFFLQYTFNSEVYSVAEAETWRYPSDVEKLDAEVFRSLFGRKGVSSIEIHNESYSDCLRNCEITDDRSKLDQTTIWVSWGTVLGLASFLGGLTFGVVKAMRSSFIGQCLRAGTATAFFIEVEEIQNPHPHPMNNKWLGGAAFVIAFLVTTITLIMPTVGYIHRYGEWLGRNLLRFLNGEDKDTDATLTSVILQKNDKKEEVKDDNKVETSTDDIV